MSNIAKETVTVSFTYELTVDTDTGEVLETKLLSKDTSKPKANNQAKNEVNDGEPKLILEENKYRLTNSAIKLLQLEDTDKIAIKYESRKNGSVPVIGSNRAFGISSGNKLTKSNTVACRGSNHDELAKYGTEFTLVPHPSKKGLFILSNGEKADEPEEVDENVNIEGDEGEDLPFDLSLDNLEDNEDKNITEIDSNFFQL